MTKPHIHPSAFVGDGATIGAGTRIWHVCHVMSGASIGADCTLGHGVFVGPGVQIGNRVKIQNHVSVFSGVTLEDDVFCGPSCVFTNVMRPRAAFPRGEAAYDPTVVRHGATIGANATVVCGHTIGAHAFIAAGAVVTQDVPAYALAVGNPARVQGYVCACGEPLDFAGDRAQCTCGRQYAKDGGVVREDAPIDEDAGSRK